MEQPELKERVWQIIQALNRAWAAERNVDKLKNYFHKDMVAIATTPRERIEGRDACIAAWKAFVEATKIHYMKEIDPKVQLYGDGRFAVVTYYFEISYEKGGRTVKEKGRDMFVLVNEDGKWWVVADQFSYPKE